MEITPKEEVRIGLTFRGPQTHGSSSFGQMQRENCYLLSLLKRDSLFLPSTYLPSSQFLTLPGYSVRLIGARYVEQHFKREFGRKNLRIVFLVKRRGSHHVSLVFVFPL